MSNVLVNGGTALEWAVENPIVPVNIIGSESDTGKIKQGDGVQTWNSLPYSLPSDLGITAFNAVTEWWIQPIATYLSSPYPRIVHGAISSSGDILACEYNPTTDKIKRVISGDSVIDDHACPAIWAEEGRRFLLGWCDHGTDIKVKFKCSTVNGDLNSFATAPEFYFSNGAGEGATYTQIIKITHLCTDSLDVFWVFSRRTNLSWQVIPVYVEQDTGLITFGVHKILFLSASQQCYMSIADAHVASPGNQVIRIAIGYNPAATLHAVFGFEIDVVTGTITNVVDDTFTANISGTNLPISDATPPVALLAEPAAGNSRRLFYVRPGPDAYAVAYADWDTDTPDSAVYKLIELPPPVVSLGLKHNSVYGAGYAQAAYKAAMQTNTWEYQVSFTFSAAPTAQVELGRRANSGSDGNWWFRINTDRSFLLGFMYHPSGATVNVINGGTVLPGNWTDRMTLRVVVSDALTPKVSLDYSTDDGQNWTNLIQADPAGLVAGFRVSSAPIVVPALAQNDNILKLTVHSVSFKTGTGGTLIAGVDFESGWLSSESTYIDAASTNWSLVGQAYIAQNTQLVTEYGISGPRVGYTDDANYVGGMSFQNPSSDRVVYTSHSGGGIETINKHLPNYGISKQLIQSKSSNGRLIRTYGIINESPYDIVYTDMDSYSPTTYTIYSGNVKII
jgi:hypothetical protein